MTYGTPSVAAATTPTVLLSFFSHYISKRKRLKLALANDTEDPAAMELSYDEGVRVIRRFLEFASKHTLEEIQSFTAMHVPCPNWVKKEIVTLPYIGCIDRAEAYLERQLESYGPTSVDRVGGLNWWKVRGRELEGEWIEMKRDYVQRKASAAVLTPEEYQSTERVILYIHGGAYFFSSLDTHRYQIQRHARKLGGRAFAPAYRLAPQYPFPCGLLDCLAAYLYLIDPPQGAIHQPIHPSSIIVAGDSAGGGCALSLLIMLRDLGLPMPAGADLLSPWVDLSHSFPSILANAETDYIPGNGFHFKPSLAWPPVKGTALRIPGLGPDDESIEIDEQIQLYCPNVLITHPLVSPVNQGSLGGLCPLLIHSGGGELLRDEQIYLAHKAANPSAFPPSPAVIRDYPILANQLKQHQKGSRVQLQVFDGCAHVIPTLAMTLPAKYMYRSAANFNLWAIKLAKAKLASHGRNDRHPDSSRHDDSASHTPSRASTLLVANGRHDVRGMTGSLNSSVVDLGTQDGRMSLNKSPEIDAQSEADEAEGESSSSSSSEDEGADDHSYTLNGTVPHSDEKITVTGALPSFGPGRIIRQRVSCKGKIRSMESMTDIEALHIPPHRVGQVHAAGPVSKWLETRQKYEKKYAKEVQKYRKIRADDYQLARDNGFLTRTLHGEEPPHCAIASWYDLDLARKVGRSVDEVSTKSNAAVMMYMRMSQKPDEEQVGEYTDSSRQAVQEVIATEGEEIKKTASRPAQ